MKRKSAIKSFVLGAMATFLLGFGVMYLLWKILGTSEGLPGLFYYRAATIGDGICLPILVGSGMAFIQYNKSLRIRRNKTSILMAIIASLIAALIQASWLISDSTVLNWSLPKLHHFNLAGWYHSLFFIAMFGIITYLMSEIWHVIQKKTESYSWFEKVQYMLLISSGMLFILMFVADDYGKRFSMVILMTAAAIAVLIMLTIYLRSAKKRFDQELFSTVLSGILCAYSLSVFICVPIRGDIAIALGSGLCACFLWRIEKFSLRQIICKDIWTILFYACAFSVVSGLHNKIELICALLFLGILTIISEKVYIGEIRYRCFALVVIEVYIVISTFFQDLLVDGGVIELIFTAVVYVLFNKEIKEYFHFVENAEVEKNNNKITSKEFKRIKGAAYLQIVLGILAVIILVCRWILDIARTNQIKIEIGMIYIPIWSVIVWGIAAAFLFILGIRKNEKNIVSKVTAFFLSCIMFILIIYVNITNIGSLPSVIWMSLKWIMLSCSICACLGSAILSAHGYYMNVVWLRGLSEKKWRLPWRWFS